MNKITAALTHAKDTINGKITAYIPSSRASKIAKMFILAFTFLVVMSTPVHAAEFITEAIDILGIVIIAIGGGLGIWGVVNLLEGYANDNPGAKSQY